MKKVLLPLFIVAATIANAQEIKRLDAGSLTSGTSTIQTNVSQTPYQQSVSENQSGERAVSCEDKVTYVENNDNGQQKVAFTLGGPGGINNVAQSFPSFTGQISQVEFIAGITDETPVGGSGEVQVSIHAINASNSPMGSPIGSGFATITALGDYVATFSTPVNVTNGFAVIFWPRTENDSLIVLSNGIGSGQNPSYSTYQSSNGQTYTVSQAGINVDVWALPTIRFSLPDPTLAVTPASACTNAQVSGTINSTTLPHFNHAVYGANNFGYKLNFGDGSADVNAANGSRTYTNAGSYAVTGNTVYSGWTNECVSTTATQTVTIMPGVTSFFSYAATGLSVQFTSLAQGATTYSWNFGDGGTAGSPNPVRNYATAGTYTVEFTATGTCGTDLYYKNITIAEGENNSDLGVEEQSGIHLTIYPNPISNVFSVAYETEQAADIRAELLTLDGKRIDTQTSVNTMNGELTFDVSNLSSGIYLLNMNVSGKLISKKIVKE